MPETKKRFCEKCKKVLAETEFYQSNNLDKYPDGKLKMCKKCLTMHVDNWNADTYLWILQECDVPYVPDEWDKLLVKWGRDKSKLTGATIIGRYLAKMKLKQFAKCRWADTQNLKEVRNKKMEEVMQEQGYTASEIMKVISERSQHQIVPEGDVEIPQYVSEEEEKEEEIEDNGAVQYSNAASGYGFMPMEDEDDAALDLTEEDRTYLKLKWGKTYRPTEWVQLEQLYNDMMSSYDITQAGDMNTLKLVCKASLKTNQLMDLGDIDGAQKMSKVYDGFMKSGKWTAAQNKAETDNVVDSVGELVAMCEAEGYIPEYYVDTPNDKADRVIQDMQIYTRQLVTEELGLGNLIENSFKMLQDENERIKAASEASENVEDQAEEELFNYNAGTPEELTTDDYVDFNSFEEDWQAQAKKVLEEQEDEE